MFGHVDIHFDDMFKFRISAHTRWHNYKLFTKRNTSSLRLSFNTERVVNVWNHHLPSDVVEFICIRKKYEAGTWTLPIT